jgi:hypothetical protein
MPQEKHATPLKPSRPERPEFHAESFEGESARRSVIDASGETVYIRKVPVKKVQVGQVWKKNDTGDSFLVTKIYNEALTSFAVLRKTGSESEPPMRVKVAHTSGTADLPGFSYTQQSDDF